MDREHVQADALQEPQEGQDLRDRGRPGRPGHARRALHDPEQGRQSGLARAELRLGGRPGGQGHRRRRPVEPDQGPLDGHLRRRRRARHLRRRVDRLAPPRTAASACTCRTSRSSTTRSRSALRSTSPSELRPDRRRRRSPISAGGTSCQPCCSREAWWSEWRMTRVPMNTPLVSLRITAYHSVLASRSPRTGCHGSAAARRTRRRRRAATSCVEGGDLTRGRVDEEGAHAHPGYGGRVRALAGRPADVRRRPAAPRRRRPHAPRLRHRRGRAGRLGDRERAQPRPGRLQGPAPLGRAALPARRRAAHDGAQARLDPQPVPQPARARRGRRPTPPTCCPRRGCRRRCPRRSSPTTSPALLEKIPASTPLEQRDRALFELAYSSGLRAEELVDLDVNSIDFDAGAGPRRGQGC